LCIIILTQRWYYNRKLRTVIAEKDKVEQIAESRLKEIDSLKTIVMSVKAEEKIYITTKEIIHQTDTIIKTEKIYVPRESDFEIRIDTLGKVDIIYRKWGGCFVPAIDLDLLPIGHTFGGSARLVYAGPWGLDIGFGLYPILGVKAEISRRLPKFTNCKIKGGVFHNGKSLMGYAGCGIYLW